MSATLMHIWGFLQVTILLSNMKRILLCDKQNTSLFPQNMSFSQNVDLVFWLEISCACCHQRRNSHWNHFSQSNSEMMKNSSSLSLSPSFVRYLPLSGSLTFVSGQASKTSESVYGMDARDGYIGVVMKTLCHHFWLSKIFVYRVTRNENRRLSCLHRLTVQIWKKNPTWFLGRKKLFCSFLCWTFLPQHGCTKPQMCLLICYN